MTASRRPGLGNQRTAYISQGVHVNPGERGMCPKSIPKSSAPAYDRPTAPDLIEFEVYLRSMGFASTTVGVYLWWVRWALRVVSKPVSAWTMSDLTKLALAYEEPLPGKTRGYGSSSRLLSKSAIKWYLDVSQRADLMSGPFWHHAKTKSRRDYILAHTASPEQVAKVLGACQAAIQDPATSNGNVQAYAEMFLVAAYGLRCMEICNLRVQDVDLDEGCLHIKHSKGGKSRDVLMDVDLTFIWGRILTARAAIVEGIRKRNPKAGKEIDAGRWLFVAKTSRAKAIKLPRESVKSTIEWTTRKILGEPRNPHSFRHAKIFNLLDKGWKIERVASYAGHESINTTYEYIVLGLDEQRAEHERVGGRAPAAPVASSMAVAAPDERARKIWRACEDGIITAAERDAKMRELFQGGA